MNNLMTFEKFFKNWREKSNGELLKNLGFEDCTKDIGKGDFKFSQNTVEYYYNDWPVSSEHLEILKDGSVIFSKLKLTAPINITEGEPDEYEPDEYDVEQFSSLKEFLNSQKGNKTYGDPRYLFGRVG